MRSDTCTENGASQRPASAVLEVRGASKFFGPNQVLKDVTLALHSQEIRAICGENGAGKSTLVKILTGVHRLDGGQIFLDGKPIELSRPRLAQEHGIALVAQELSLAPALSVLDNIWLGSREVPIFHRQRTFRDRAGIALEKIGLDPILLDRPVSELSIGQRQLVELARMLSRDARVFILDEPTATLSDVEIGRIFDALRRLRTEGKCIIYITHRLGEVFDLCDSVSVLRNGQLVGTRQIAEINRDHLMTMMLGRSLADMYPCWEANAGQPTLTVKHLSVPPVVRDFNLIAKRGQVLCLAGQVGSGATDILRALAGLVPDATGEVVADNRAIRLRSVARVQSARMRFVSEDRAGEGVFLRLTVKQNLVASRLAEFSRLGALNRRRMRAAAARLAAAAGIDSSRLASLTDELSGGNQQKVAFGRSIGHQVPGILLMNEPTRGVDVGARAEIYRLIREICEHGYAVLIASSDIEEVLGVADLIISMYRGRKVATYRRGEGSMQRILADITHPTMAA
jgi:ABC-type sugar transport system ATPase subunit